ncbi:MAG: hypothetical protein IJ767_06675 [Bacteroidaceae bacterium]|nr:hypothetical protein [Bacteroidaceae bacterium]
MDQHFHPLINQRLRHLFDDGDHEALIAYLESLSHSHFRTAGYLIGERMLPTLPPDDFWRVAQTLILWHSRAFTVTVAKAAALRLTQHSLSLYDDGFLRLADALHDEHHIIDRQKLVAQWLPVIDDFMVMEHLFDRLGITQPRRRVEFLLHTDGLVAAFVLLRTLRFEEHDAAYLTSVCRQLMRRASTLFHSTGHADSLSFNLASLLRTYFDLPDLQGTFSLNIAPYELSRIDTDFDTFRRRMKD